MRTHTVDFKNCFEIQSTGIIINMESDVQEIGHRFFYTHYITRKQT